LASLRPRLAGKRVVLSWEFRLERPRVSVTGFSSPLVHRLLPAPPERSGVPSSHVEDRDAATLANLAWARAARCARSTRRSNIRRISYNTQHAGLAESTGAIAQVANEGIWRPRPSRAGSAEVTRVSENDFEAARIVTER
jgi:hypothetical protein